MTVSPRSAVSRGQQHERIRAVLAEVRQGRGTVDELTAAIGVSAATIRRDLAQLVEEGQVARTYGGAVAVHHMVEPAVSEKARRNHQEKAAIAAAAAAFVADGETVILDAGTTTVQFARVLTSLRGLTVVTNGVNCLSILAENPEIEVIGLGGTLRKLNGAFVGASAENILRRVVADHVFLGASGLVPELGISCPSLDLSSIKTLMAARATNVYVLADHTKLDLAPFPFFAPIDGECTLVTDNAATEEQVHRLEDAGGWRVVRADPVSAPVEWGA